MLRWQQSRTGFVGTGLPAKRQDVNGIPGGDPVPGSAPLFMGFKSGLRRNQATEDAVTIPGGPFAGGTTMHVSYLRLRLGTWYGQMSEPERVARMYAPQVTPEQVSEFTTDAESDPDLLGQAITRYGVIGHAQASATARRGGRPVILRRDFDTTDGGLAGLHFVSLQRTDRGLRRHPDGDERRRRAAAEPVDHRHGEQRHQRVHLRPAPRQLHCPGARPAVVPAAARPGDRARLRRDAAAGG